MASTLGNSRNGLSKIAEYETVIEALNNDANNNLNENTVLRCTKHVLEVNRLLMNDNRIVLLSLEIPT